MKGLQLALKEREIEIYLNAVLEDKEVLKAQLPRDL